MHLVFCLRFRKLLKALPWPFSIWRFLEIKHYECFRCTLLLCHYSKAWHEHFMLLHFCCSKIKVHLQRMIFFPCNGSIHISWSCCQWPCSWGLDWWTASCHKDTWRVWEICSCWVLPTSPWPPTYKRTSSTIGNVLLCVACFNFYVWFLRYAIMHNWWILTRPLAPFHALCIG